MDLAVRRDIDDHVLHDPGSTTQTVAGAQWSPALIVGLGGSGLGETVGTGLDAGSAAHDHLAAPAYSPAAAYRIEVYSKCPGGVQHCGALGKRPASP
jgi:hypothetical protein